MSLVSEHYLDGKHARREGEPMRPADGTRERNEWRRGWNDEDREILALRSGRDE